MTSGAPPPGTGNKDLPASDPRLNPDDAPSSSAHGNPMNDNQNVTDKQKRSENASRVACNIALQTQRDAGKVGVPSDESLIDISHPTTPVSSSPNLIQLLTAISQFSPNSQRQVQTLINNSLKSTPETSSPTSPSLPASKILFSSADEMPSSSSTTDYGFSTHPFILQLAQNKFHIPLTLFTTKSTNKLHKESLVQKIMYKSNGTKCHTVELSQFPDEHQMDIGDWHEAWNWYLTFLTTYHNGPSAKRWHAHYLFLSKQDNFKLNFPTILKFDM